MSSFVRNFVLTRRLILIAVIAALVTAVACGSGEEPAAEPTAPSSGSVATSTAGTSTTTAGPTAIPATSTPLPPDELASSQVLKVRQYNEPASLDPAFLFRIETENVAFNIYNGLTSFDAVTGEIIPDLAESWSLSSDGLTYTFEIVDDAVWHQDFGALTAEDVAWSYNRVLDPDVGSPYRAEFNNIASVTAVDDDTVEIELIAPDGNFLFQVSSYHQGQVLKKEAVEKYGDQYLNNPVGTGPYELVDWIPNTQMTLKANPGYFGGETTLTEIQYILIRDITAAEAALLNGEVDIAMNINSNETVDRLRDKDGINLHIRENYAAVVWMLSSDFEPFQDLRVRQAMAYAVDDAGIENALQPNLRFPSTNFIPDWMPNYETDVPTYAYDPAKALDLLAEAGYPDGFTVKILGTSVNEANQARQAQWAEVGIDVVFENVEPAIYNQRRNTGNFEMAGRLYPAVNPDTLFFGYLHPDNAAPNGLNGAKYSDPEMTALLGAARASQDPGERADLYSQIQVKAMTDLPYIPYTGANVVWASGSYVNGVQINPLAQVSFFPVSLAKK